MSMPSVAKKVALAAGLAVFRVVAAGPVDVDSWNSAYDPAVLTTSAIAEGKARILVVRHDKGPGGWQLYDGADPSARAPAVLLKSRALELEPALAQVTDLPVGWIATRSGPAASWVRMKR
ncbi:MAG: hypothetical protein P4L83_22455 [Nevskia sp.]|nr:hypothetical protein [Nevskia sp.]